MKKLIVSALLISAVSVFAESFSKTKFDQLKKSKKYEEVRKYAYESEISKQSDYSHAYWSVSYFCKQKKFNATKAEIVAQVNKFKSILKNKQIEILMGCVYIRCNLYNEALSIINSSDNNYVKLVLRKESFNANMKNKNKDLMWKYGKDILLTDGGYDNPEFLTKIIQFMFRYKPANITKEQQIELLTKIADMYPIPGTDFAKWKGFMGFVGFKYKALTGKDLF